ncbi:MAG: glycosyltransferase 87 family protein, partial [Desulfomonilaceae bacterium]
LIGCHAALAWISPEFGYDLPLLEQPVVTMVFIELAAGAVFLLAVWGAVSRRWTKDRAFPWIICVGIFLRGVMFVSTPMLEHDYYRYLWDGAVLANGVNPYLYSPKQAVDASEPVHGPLVRLVHQSGAVIARVSFRELRTIYPPVAQAAFAAAYMLRPWSEFTLRIVLALFDGATLIILLIALRSLDLPYSLVAVYWWNPLVVRETFNTMHLDVIALPFALAAVFLTIRGRHLWAASTLAFAVAAKLWPIVFLPLILWPQRRKPKRALLSFGIFGLMSAILFVPVFLSGIDASSGFVAYGRYWEMNDAAYRLISWGVKYILAALSLSTALTQVITRLIVGIVVVFWAIWLPRTMPLDSKQVWDRCLLIVAAVFLLSPTGFPWYYLWVVPFLAISGRPSLLLLNCMLPLYYLVYFYRARGTPQAFDSVVIWAQYLPFWGLAMWEWLSGRRRVRMTQEVACGSSQRPDDAPH